MTKVPVENYLLSMYRSFWANREDTWGPDHPDWFRVHGRDGYRVFNASNINSHLISEQALKDKINGIKPVSDHYLSPQFAAGAMLELQEKYLCPQHLNPRGNNGDRTNFEKFCEYMNKLRVIVRITKKENEKLRQLTVTENVSFPKVKVATDKKYDHLGIKLYKLPDGEGLTVNLAKKVFETQSPLKASTVLHFPKDLLIYEKRFLVN
tara:strand:+ start:660 stop:1283 length:624 start_codon:yes stop_codon:yes gene_type:complete